MNSFKNVVGILVLVGVVSFGSAFADHGLGIPDGRYQFPNQSSPAYFQIKCRQLGHGCQQIVEKNRQNRPWHFIASVEHSRELERNVLLLVEQALAKPSDRQSELIASKYVLDKPIHNCFRVTMHFDLMTLCTSEPSESKFLYVFSKPTKDESCLGGICFRAISTREINNE
jgi:hypothetical protein